MLNRTEAPEITSVKDFNIELAPLKSFSLNNNVQLYWIQAGVQDVARVDFVFKAGNLNSNKIGVASAVSSLLKNGTSQKTAFEINETFDFYGASITRSAGTETATVTLSVLSKFLPQTLALTKEILTDAIFPENEIDIFKQNCKQNLAVSLKKVDFVADRTIDELQFGTTHPYGRFISVPEQYDEIDRDDLINFYNQHYKNCELYIFVSGNLPSDIVEQVNTLFGQLPYLPFQFNFNFSAPQPSTTLKHRIKIQDSNGSQGAIRISRDFPGRKHPDFFACLVLNMLYGGFFGSRLMSNIREDKGYTYGIYSYIQNKLGSTAWQISTEAGADVCEATIAECYKEMDVLKTELVDDEELDLVKNYMLGSLLGDLDSPFNVAARWRTLLSNNYDIDYFNTYVNAIKNVDAITLQRMAQKYFVQNEFFEMVVS